ncbi:type IV pilus secretin PilQ [Endozoicomonadaceae bacterium StTr2]
MTTRRGALHHWSAMLLGLSLMLVASLAQAVTLRDMGVASLPGEKVELRLVFDGPAPQSTGYTVDQPPRISLDLSATQSAIPKYNDVGFSNTRSVTVLQGPTSTRLVVNLNKPSGYTTRIEGNVLYLVVGVDQNSVQKHASRPAVQPHMQQGYSQMPPQGYPQPLYPASPMAGMNAMQPVMPPPIPSSTYLPQPAPTMPGAGDVVPEGVSKIDFQRGEEGEGNIVITLENASVPVDLSEEGGRIRLEFTGSEIPRKLRNRLDVVDFATPVQFIDAKVEDGNTVIVIEPTGQYDYLAWQADNVMTVSVKPLTKQEEEKRRKDRFTYTGQKLSLNFQDIEVRSVLQLIADFVDLNLVASDTVNGNVTLRLQNVPWDQALDIVLKAKGLDKRLEGNVLTVAPAEEIAARERQVLENDKQISELAPLYTEFFQVNYADAKTLFEIFKGEGESEGILSERGKVIVDDRTNSIVLTETQSKLDEFRRLLERIDIPVRQVMIEARIVNANANYSKQLGVKWSGGLNLSTGSKRSVIGGSGSTQQFDSGADLFDGNNKNKFNVNNGSTGFTGTNPFVDLGVKNPTGALAVGFMSGSAILNLELNAMQSDGAGEIISQPKVITSDKKTAHINSGREIPYLEASSSGAASISFKEAVLSLEVTPQITPGGKIIMDIKVTNDQQGEAVFNGVPVIDKNEIATQILVRDGETVVLGGIFTRDYSNTQEKVPLLGDLPVVGQLFRRDISRDNKREMLIFITPKVLQDGVAVR